MAERYTRKDAGRAFERLREAKGARLASDYGIYDPEREGAWALDHNATYGGYVVVEIIASSPPRKGEDRQQSYTAEHHPLGNARLPAREFCYAVNFALRVLAC